jgi:predicted negative regulator of RcsB-dependent stress response
MENEEKINLITEVQNFLKNNKKKVITSFALLIIALISFIFFNNYQSSKNEKVSEKFIQAGIYLSSDNKEQSTQIYKEIILSKNKFYSLLALNEIIDNDLVTNNEEVLRLFKIIESIKVEKEQKNLIKLKKALYLIKISKNEEGKKLLSEIISDNSIWKDAATEISKQ